LITRPSIRTSASNAFKRDRNDNLCHMTPPITFLGSIIQDAALTDKNHNYLIESYSIFPPQHKNERGSGI
jgi:hypothetical protein